jgi:L-threonylcarbamoyladenylate synthase
VPTEAPVVRTDAPDAVDVTAEALWQGDVVIVPTETVYGVAALPARRDAIARLFALKGRPQAVPIAVLVASAEQAESLAVFGPVARRLADRLWPGPLTLVVPRQPAARGLDLGGLASTVGVRCPDNDFVRALARRVGPIATTSANRHGRPTAATAAEAVASLTGDVGVVVDGGRCGGVASTVVDCTGPELQILRSGTISLDDMRAASE